jgi:glyoxylase-like metal-dependent hydrolase (beta-lactamase superfamily II)
MKALHRPDLWAWSAFDTARNVDFNSYLWVNDAGNVVVDPMPMSDHDRAHLKELGGAKWIVITNSDHIRDSAALAEATGAQIVGPAAEREGFSVDCARWLAAGDEVVPGMAALTMNGSKTAGELALIIGDHTLITGDLVRAHRGGSLMMLPAEKLTDMAAARGSVAALAEHQSLEAVLVGDGWPVFRGGQARLAELVASF